VESPKTLILLILLTATFIQLRQVA